MSNEPKGRWPKRWRFYGVVTLFPLLCVFLVYWGFWAPGSGFPKDEPAEGFYWSASQYQIEFGKLREQLLQMSGSSPDRSDDASVHEEDLQDFSLRADLLMSRRQLLTAPSRLHDGLRTVPGFEKHAAAVLAFDKAVGEAMNTRPFSPMMARSLLRSMDSMAPSVSNFSNAAREREMAARTELVQLAQHRGWYSLTVVLLLLGWLAWILRVQSQDRRQTRTLERVLGAEQLAKSELQQSINTKAQFLSMVSHELRSPLQVIVSSVDLLGGQADPIERRDAVARIRRAALMLGVQLRDLLTIARGEAGRLETNLESFEATAFVEDVADVAIYAARGKGLSFSLQVPDEPIFVRADVQRISQVLANLVSNAIKYTATGDVTLALRAPDETSGKLVFEIADTGPGLPQRGVDRLQTRLSRDEELRPRTDGSGVGLSVVRTVAEHLGATIDLEVKPGAGTHFRVTVPVIFEDPEEVPSDATPDGLVLVVDDKPDIAVSVTAIVKQYGHPCHSALSGKEAAAMLEREIYETAFIDLDLPELGGVELARRVRASVGPNAQTYIVAITADRPEIPEGLFDEVLIKPVESLRVWWHLGHRSRRRAGRKALHPDLVTSPAEQ